MRTRQLGCVSFILACTCFAAQTRAQANAAAEPTPAPSMNLSPSPADAGASPAKAASASKDAPQNGAVVLGGSLGGGQIRDRAMGAGGVALEAHLGYFPLDWLGLLASGGIFAHSVDDERTLNLYSGALLAEVHPLPRVWLSAGPGYYSLGLTNDDKEAVVKPKARATAVGGEANIGVDIYRSRKEGGLSTGLVVRSQLAVFDGETAFTTLGMIGIRYYAGGGGSAVTRTTTPMANEAEGPLSVSSSCGDPVSQLFSVLNLGGRPCAYSFGGSGPLMQLTSFAARLLKGTTYGVWLGRLSGVGNTIQGVSVRYDSARQAVQLLRHGANGVTASGLVTVAAAGTSQRWRVARTGQRALVWLNERLIVNEPTTGDTTESGLLTDGAEVEVGSVQRTKLEEGQARELEAMPPTPWPAAELPAPTTAPAEEPVPAPAAPAAEPVDQAGTPVLRDYYSGLNGGGFEAGSYFAPQVTRYIGMRGTSPTAIQTYMDRTFPRQYRQARFEMDPSTYREAAPGQASYVERATYFNVDKNKYEKVVSVVQVRFDAQGRITALWQDKVLERNASDQPIP